MGSGEYLWGLNLHLMTWVEFDSSYSTLGIPVLAFRGLEQLWVIFALLLLLSIIGFLDLVTLGIWVCFVEFVYGLLVQI